MLILMRSGRNKPDQISSRAKYKYKVLISSVGNTDYILSVLNEAVKRNYKVAKIADRAA